MSLHHSPYQTAFDLSPAAQVIMDHRGCIDDVNQLACTSLGYARSTLLGQRLADLVHVDEQPVLFGAIEDSARTLMPFEMDCRVQSPVHGLRWFAVQARAHQLEDGRLRWFCVFNDITDRKRHAAWLNERNGLLTALSHNLPGMIYVFREGPDVAGHLDFVSEGVREMFGATPEQALASPWVLYNRVMPEDLARFFQQRDEAISGSVRLHSEFRVLNAQGEWRWCAADSISGFDAEGQEVRCGYIADITEHKLYQEACVAAETAQRASQAKSEFLSRMSHELRTPLNAVIGFAQLLRLDAQSPLQDDQLRKVRLIERAGGHLLAVISDVLDLSRIEAGDLPMSQESLQLATVLQDAVSMVSEAAEQAQVDLAVPTLPLDVAVHADRVRLRQVLVNLLSNAIKYNHAGGFVRVHAWHDAGRVHCSVSDSGAGMTPEQQAQLFEPFNRLGAEQTGIDGTGIGLVIVQRLVALMNGQLSVESQRGVGSVFTVSLPATDTAESSGFAALDDWPMQSSQAKIVYAEDNEVNVQLVSQILALRPAWTLKVAHSGQEALALISAEQPDLLLLDMHLGDMTGFELDDALQANPRTRGIPRVALSADAMPDRVHAAQARGFSAYLTKPLDVVALLRCLDELLGGAG
ncbi:MAG: ATP-binding protein, partial [Aquabacterium sp.]